MSAILLVIVTVFLPPLGVFLVAGCGPDLLINVILTLLGYIPGHIHAFYLLYVYYTKKDQALHGGIVNDGPSPGIFSDNVQRGGQKYATM